jgi:sodium/potassium-transporting ATPase subunit alpha
MSRSELKKQELERKSSNAVVAASREAAMKDKLKEHGTFHHVDIADCLSQLGSDLTKGLDSSAVEGIRKRTGHDNSLTPPAKTPWYVKFFEHMTGLFSLLLWVAAAMCFIAVLLDSQQVEYLYLGAVLAIVTFLTGCFSYYQDASAEAKMEGFKNFLAATVICIRDGKEIANLPAEELVPGDIIRINNGDKVPADVRILESSNISVDNSSLTGENLAQKRNAEISTAPHSQCLEANNLLFFGTLITNGNCLAMVTWTGDDTVIGKIASLMRATVPVPTPISIEIHHFIQIVTGVAIFLGVTFVIIGFIKELPIVDNMVFGIGIIVANVPEGLLATVTLSLTLTASRMKDKKVLVKNLEAVETLGSTTCIASDKTGTLTMNRMTLVNLYYDNAKRVASEGQGGYDTTNETFLALARVLALNTKTVFVDKEENMQLEPKNRLCSGGDASETAMVKFVEPVLNSVLNTNISAYRAANKKIHEIPFNSANKYALSIHKLQSGDSKLNDSLKLCMKGAAERIFALCQFVKVGGRTVEKTAEHTATFDAAVRSLMFDGLRVLACCECDLDKETFDENYPYSDTAPYNFLPGLPEDPGNPEQCRAAKTGLVFLGLTALQDPPRPAVPGAVQNCKSASIKVVMVTGDHPDTAEAIARQTHIIKSHTRRSLARKRKLALDQIHQISPDDSDIGAIVITGAELAEMDDETLKDKLNYDEIVFARTSPAQKLQIVQAFQNKTETRDKDGNIEPCKHVVAVTGDGVNDAPALKAADIGIAMFSGSDVAKDSADMVLLDDNFASIVAGVEEGRLIFDNLKKSIAYTLSSNIPEISPFLLFILIQIPLPLPTVLILCIDLGTDMVPAISLAYENAEANIMKKKPRDSAKDRLVTTKLVVFSYLQIGIFQAVAGFYCYFVVLSDYGFDPSILPFLAPYWDEANLRPIGGPYEYFEIPGEEPRWLKPCNVEREGPLNPCHNPKEALAHAQTAFFISIIIVQWADLVCCKTRELSLFNQSMRNGWLNFGLGWETALGFLLCYIPAFHLPFGTRDINFVHWLPALPFCMAILAYDETRKYLMRNLGKNNWLWENTYY